MKVFKKIMIIPSSYFAEVVAFVDKIGLNSASMLQKAEIDTRKASNSAGYMPARDFVRFCNLLMTSAPSPKVCYDLALSSVITSHGALGVALMSCENFKEVINIAIKYYKIRITFFNAELLTDTVNGKHMTCIKFSESMSLGECRVEHINALIFNLLTSLQFLLGSNDSGIEVWHDYPEPSYFAEYKDTFAVAMHFDKNSVQIRIPTELLDTPVLYANKIVKEMALAQCEEELTKLLFHNQIYSIKDLVLAELQGLQPPYPVLSVMAKQLNLSESTLKRRLQEEGTSYTVLVAKARLEISKKLLVNTSLSIEMISDQLGFSDATNFSRAFKAWASESPKDYRKRNSPRVSN